MCRESSLVPENAVHTKPDAKGFVPGLYMNIVCPFHNRLCDYVIEDGYYVVPAFGSGKVRAANYQIFSSLFINSRRAEGQILVVSIIYRPFSCLRFLVSGFMVFCRLLSEVRYSKFDVGC